MRKQRGSYKDSSQEQSRKAKTDNQTTASMGNAVARPSVVRVRQDVGSEGEPGTNRYAFRTQRARLQYRRSPTRRGTRRSGVQPRRPTKTMTPEFIKYPKMA